MRSLDMRALASVPWSRWRPTLDVSRESVMLRGLVTASGLVLAVLLASCASNESAATSTPSPTSAATTTTTTIPGPWALEAKLFFAGFRDTRMGTNPEHLAAFYHVDAVSENKMWGLRLDGRDEILEFVSTQVEQPVSWKLSQLFVTADRAAVMSEGVDTGSGDLTPFTELGVYDLVDGLIFFDSAEWPMPSLSRWGMLTEARADQMLSLYERYVTAWDSGDLDRVQSVYRGGATRSDGLFGGSGILGEDWAESIPQHLGVSAGDTDYEPVGTSFQVREETVTGAVFAPSSVADPVVAHAVFNIRNSDGCPLRLLAEWELDDFQIVREEIFYEVASLRMCGPSYGLDLLPEGWWSGLAPPEAFPEELTGRVATEAGQAIAVTNGGRRQIELLEWGLGRFEIAGLPPPRLDQVGFPPNSLCAAGGATGLASYDAASARIYMCLQESEVCIGPTCDRLRSVARFGMLHELGHVWEFQNVDDSTRQAFLAQRGLEVWSDANPAWAKESGEGIEHAGEILAWGLMDEAPPVIRIPNATPDDLTAGFRLLTKIEPLVTARE